MSYDTEFDIIINVLVFFSGASVGGFLALVAKDFLDAPKKLPNGKPDCEGCLYLLGQLEIESHQAASNFGKWLRANDSRVKLTEALKSARSVLRASSLAVTTQYDSYGRRRQVPTRRAIKCTHVLRDVESVLHQHGTE